MSLSCAWAGFCRSLVVLTKESVAPGVEHPITLLAKDSYGQYTSILSVAARSADGPRTVEMQCTLTSTAVTSAGKRAEVPYDVRLVPSTAEAVLYAFDPASDTADQANPCARDVEAGRVDCQVVVALTQEARAAMHARATGVRGFSGVLEIQLRTADGTELVAEAPVHIAPHSFDCMLQVDDSGARVDGGASSGSRAPGHTLTRSATRVCPPVSIECVNGETLPTFRLALYNSVHELFCPQPLEPAGAWVVCIFDPQRCLTFFNDGLEPTKEALDAVACLPCCKNGAYPPKPGHGLPYAVVPLSQDGIATFDGVKVLRPATSRTSRHALRVYVACTTKRVLPSAGAQPRSLAGDATLDGDGDVIMGSTPSSPGRQPSRPKTPSVGSSLSSRGRARGGGGNASVDKSAFAEVHLTVKASELPAEVAFVNEAGERLGVRCLLASRLRACSPGKRCDCYLHPLSVRCAGSPTSGGRHQARW